MGCIPLSRFAPGVATLLPGAWPTGMGFSGLFRPMRRCRGSVAVHLGGPPCPSVRWMLASRTRRLSPTRDAHIIGPETSRTSPAPGNWELSFSIASPVVFAAASPVRLLLATSAVPLLPPRSGARCPLRRALLGLFKDRLSIGSHARVPVRGCESALARRLVAVGAGVASALARLPPWVPTSSFGYDLAGFFLLLVAGVLHPAPILGFGSFHTVSALTSTALPAPLSRPTKPFSPREAAWPAHARPAAARQAPAVASLRFTEPLAASSFAVAGGDLAVLLLPRSCTNRCALPRADRRCSPGLEPRRLRVAAVTRGRVRQRTFERTPSR